MVQGGLNWMAGSSLVWGFEILLVQSSYGASIRRLHFLTAIAVKSLVLLMIVILMGLFNGAYYEGLLDLNFVADAQFLRTLSFVFAAIIVMQMASQIVRIVGARTLINFVLGRYHRPVREDKIFMFLDLVGSTALAESLGDVGVQTMITNFFFDITEPIVEFGGEIHRYVGDMVVVTWPLRAGNDNMRSIRCCFAIADHIRDKAAEYEQKFGTVPTFRIGLHGGPVVISQMGDQKQEISYFGDTINTTARIEQECKTLDCPLLVSGDLLKQIALPAGYQAKKMGSVQLRGRQLESDLYTIARNA